MAKGKFWSEFKDFAMKGNVIDLAVGVVVGGAFGKIVTSLVNDVIMPCVGVLIGGFDFINLKIVLHKAVMEGSEVVKPAVTLNYGNFIQETVNFLIITFSIFLAIKGNWPSCRGRRKRLPQPLRHRLLSLMMLSFLRRYAIF